MPLIDPRQIKNGTALLTRIEELERKVEELTKKIEEMENKNK